MKVRFELPTIIIFILSFGLASCGASPREPVIDAALPLPLGASDQLQTSIKILPSRSLAKVRSEFPQTHDEWRSLIQSRDAIKSLRADASAKTLGVTVEEAVIGGVVVRWIMPNQVNPIHAQHIFVHLHGGAYVFSAGMAGVLEAIVIASRLQMPVVSVDYRMPPDHPFPAAVEDTIAVYLDLLESYPPSAIAIGGTSAGGGLAIAAVQEVLRRGSVAPGALFAGTPWTDLTKVGDSYFINEGVDRFVVSYDGFLEAAAQLYMADQDPQNPMASPIYGEFGGLPPTYLVSGTRDLFLSNTIRAHRKLREAGVTADLNIYEGVSHADYLVLPNSPESHQVYKELELFITKYLSR